VRIVLAVVASTLGVATHAGSIAGLGFSVVVPPGWQGRISKPDGPSPAALNLANFSIPRRNFLDGNDDPATRWRRDAVLLTVLDWTRSLTASTRGQFRPASALALRSEDFRRGGFEGIPQGHAFARRSMRVDGRSLEVWAQLGKPAASSADIAGVNRVLARIRLTR
jgi:hypothetical protein